MKANPDTTALPVQEWNAVMSESADGIDRVGGRLVTACRRAGDRADEVCRNWRLAERQAAQRGVLDDLFGVTRGILERLDRAILEPGPSSYDAASNAIENGLPTIEDGFLAVRQCAQDLLHWAQRYAGGAERVLADEFRSAHGRLVSFAPIMKPRLEAFQAQLARSAVGDEVSPEARRLLSAVTRFNGVLDAARRFVHAVVEPPLELVFAETDRFVEDLQSIPLAERGPLASSLNDACQSLQYDRPAFDRRVKAIGLPQPEGVDSSLVAFGHGDYLVLLTVEEDPIFGQLTIHLLRAVGASDFDTACSDVSDALAEEWR